MIHPLLEVLAGVAGVVLSIAGAWALRTPSVPSPATMERLRQMSGGLS